MATVRWASALPTNNIATALMPLGVSLSENYRFPSNRRLAFVRPGGLKPNTWNSDSYTSVQKLLPMDMIARRARILFPKWPFSHKPNVWSYAKIEEYKYYEDTINHIRKAIYHKWTQQDYPVYYGYRPPYWICWRFMTAHNFATARLN